jgi:hypothetical protein
MRREKGRAPPSNYASGEKPPHEVRSLRISYES